MIQGRRDFLFDIDQALAAYKVLKGPSGSTSATSATRPGSRRRAHPTPDLLGEAVKWFDRFLNGTANGIDKNVIELGHDPYDGKTTTTDAAGDEDVVGDASGHDDDQRRDRQGRARRPHHGRPARDVRRHERRRPLLGREELGPARRGARGRHDADHRRRREVQRGEGTVTIKLMNEMPRVPAGKKLTLYLAPTSLAQSSANALYLAAGAAGRADHDRPRHARRVGADEGRLAMTRALVALAAAALLAVPAAGARADSHARRDADADRARRHRPADGLGVAVRAGAERREGVLRLRERPRRRATGGRSSTRSRTTSTTRRRRSASRRSSSSRTRSSRSSTRSAPSTRSPCASISTSGRCRSSSSAAAPTSSAGTRKYPVDDRAAAELPGRRRDLRTPDRRDEAEGEDRRALRGRRVRQRAARRPEARPRSQSGPDRRPQSYGLIAPPSPRR